MPKAKIVLATNEILTESSLLPIDDRQNFAQIDGLDFMQLKKPTETSYMIYGHAEYNEYIFLDIHACPHTQFDQTSI